MITKNEISVKAFNMFRDWTKNVRNKYPELVIDIVDESVLVQDLINTINDARNALLKEEKTEKRNTTGYSLGFILGFIESNLNTRWEQEYIIKQKSSYKEFIAFKAIKIFLEFEALTVIHIDNIYKHLLLSDTNIDNISFDITHERLTELSIEQDEDMSNSPIMKALDNKIVHYVNEYLKSHHEDFMKPSEHYFTESEIQDIIKNEINI